MRLAAYQRLGL